MSCLQYKMMTLEKLSKLTLSQIADRYNDAVETIWLLQEKLYYLQAQCDAWEEAYDEAVDSCWC